MRVLRTLIGVFLIFIAVMVVILVNPDPISFFGAIGLILVILYLAWNAWPKFKAWLDAIGSNHISM